MTRDRRIPNRGAAARSARSNRGRQFPESPSVPKTPASQPSISKKAGSNRPEASEPALYSVVDQVVDPTLHPGADSVSAQPNLLEQPAGSNKLRRTKVAASLPVSPRPKWLRFPTSWQFWVVSSLVGFGAVGFLSVALLLRLPALPNCPSIFWPMASASLRLYCAQVAANKQTVDDLLEAIALVNGLPPDHPLRPEIDRNLEQWSLDILKLGDDAFNAGKLPEAIAIARKIPQNVPAYQLVDERIDHWQTVWSDAEDIYRKAEAELRKENWPAAFRQAVRLLSVGNTYWETTKYQELTNLITTARDDGAKLSKARRIADQGGLENLQTALKLIQEINPGSYVYQAAQKEIPKVGRKMLNLAQATLEGRDAQEAIAIARKIPASAKLEDEVQDFVNLAQAQSQAWVGTAESLQDAILQAQKIGSDRPLYGKAQQLITRWQREIEDVAHLGRARQLAQPGTLSDLTAAIGEAQLIPRDNPRWDEAQQLISSWTGQIETAQDRPYLDRADQLAITGDVVALQAAIDEASQVGQGRALYQEARGKIREWTDQMQRMQDQPFLDQARNLANGGDVPSAIATAQQIQPGRALYNEAQGSIKAWQNLLQAQQDLQQARNLGSSPTLDNLVAAIRTADQVPSSSYLRTDADSMIEQWSQQLLSLAEEQANSNPVGAIAIAQRIPSRTSAYGTAQLRIDAWKKSLNPVPEPPSSLPSR